MEELKKEQKNVKPKVVKQKKQVVEQVVEQLVEQLVESSPEVKEEVEKVVKVKKPNNWITHVKYVAEINNLSYREALKIAGKTYTKIIMYIYINEL